MPNKGAEGAGAAGAGPAAVGNAHHEQPPGYGGEDDAEDAEGDGDAPHEASLSSVQAPGDEDLVPVTLRPAGPSIIKRPNQEPKPEPHNNVRFNEVVTVRRTWAKRDYDRKVRVARVSRRGGPRGGGGATRRLRRSRCCCVRQARSCRVAPCAG